MELANQISGVIACFFAALGFALVYVATPTDKQKAFIRIVADIVMFFVLIAGVGYVAVFALSKGSPSHLDVLILLLSLLNIKMALSYKRRISAEKYSQRSV